MGDRASIFESNLKHAFIQNPSNYNRDDQSKRGGHHGGFQHNEA